MSNANHEMTSQLVTDSEPGSTLLSVSRLTGRASRVAVLGGFAVLVLVGRAAWPGGEPTVDRPGSPVVLGCLEGRKDSTTDAVGQTTDAASEANLQDTAGEVADQAADTAGAVCPLVSCALGPILCRSPGFPPRLSQG